MKPITNRTILFTEACPLHCRYCYLEKPGTYGTTGAMENERILKEVKRIHEEVDPKKYICILTLTGGEPFTRPDVIKEIMTTYGNRFIYEFNTSGYLLDEEMIQFLAKYPVRFVLSIDGDRRLTDYLRPVRGTKYHNGYMKKMEEILPTLLYYFPLTECKFIIHPRYIDLVHRLYLFAEQIGFRRVNYILDFRTRPTDPTHNQKPWTNEDTEALKEQFVLIAQEFASGVAKGIWRPIVRQIETTMRVLLTNPQGFDPTTDLTCGLATGRALTTMYDPERSKFCMSKDFKTVDDAIEKIRKTYIECGGKCPWDPECGAFPVCLRTNCPKNGFDAYGNLLKFEELECAVSKAAYEAAILLMYYCNDPEVKSAYWNEYLRTLMKGVL